MGERMDTVEVLGQQVKSGDELTLKKSPGRRQGKYRFDWADYDGLGNLILNVYGPLNSRAAIPHYRVAGVGAVLKVHPQK